MLSRVRFFLSSPERLREGIREKRGGVGQGEEKRRRNPPRRKSTGGAGAGVFEFARVGMGRIRAKPESETEMAEDGCWWWQLGAQHG